MAWVGSNPGNLRGFRTKWMKERIETIKFLDVTTSMLPYGVPFPVLPQATEIMNIIVPNMLQNALTGKMTVKQATGQIHAERSADRTVERRLHCWGKSSQKAIWQLAAGDSAVAQCASVRLKTAL